MIKTTLALLTAAALPLAAGAEPAARETADYWRLQGQQALQAALASQPNTNRAKHVILFVGDGNGVATVTATRIFDGQAKGMTGEENQLSYERFPHLALAKTYNTNQQTPDSAGTMTAMVTGVKTSAGVISVGPEVTPGDCRNLAGSELPTLLQQARARGLATGIVSTTRITHATPAATYAHSPQRNWEADTDIPAPMRDCGRDIARQLVENGPLDVVLGGGRSQFMPAASKDPEYPDISGKRGDGRDLIAEWLTANPEGHYVWNQGQFKALAGTTGGPLLGLFEPSHMLYEADRRMGKGDEPSLAEMTAAAIARLQARDKGFFLMVEGGRIDHAHHAGNAHRALVDGQALAEAVQVAVDSTSAEDTLIIVTADHSHVLTMAGYATRGNPILGTVVTNDEHGHSSGEPYLAADGRPFTTLGYTNGPGYGQVDSPEARYLQKPRAGRFLAPGEDTTGVNFHQESLVPLAAETHGGEDVAIYASGPWAHLVHGVQEQSYIYQVMRHALGL